MSEKHSAASRARWAGIPKEERSRIMSERALQRVDKMSPKELKAHAELMNKKKAEKLKIEKV